MYVGNQETQKPLRLHNLYHLRHVGQLPIGIPAAKKEQFFFLFKKELENSNHKIGSNPRGTGWSENLVGTKPQTNKKKWQ